MADGRRLKREGPVLDAVGRRKMSHATWTWLTRDKCVTCSTSTVRGLFRPALLDRRLRLVRPVRSEALVEPAFLSSLSISSSNGILHFLRQCRGHKYASLVRS